MQRSIICFLLLITTMRVAAQSDKKKVIEIDSAAVAEKITIPFSGIRIIDARFDRTNIGCVAEDLSFRGVSRNKLQLVFPDSVDRYLPACLKRIVTMDQDAQDSLLILIKQFRITDMLPRTIKAQSEYGRKKVSTESFGSLLRVSASFYSLRQQRLIKLFSIDDDLVQKENLSAEVKLELLHNMRVKMVTQLLLQLFQGKHWEAPAGPQFALSDVAAGLHKRFDLPALKDSVVRLGLYRTFQEFKMNQPSVTNVRYRYKTDGQIEVRDFNNQLVELSDYWGLADNGTRYVVFRGQVWPLLPSDHSFRFKSYRKSSDLDKGASYGNYASNYGLIPGAIERINYADKQPEYFYLNMDTGEVYMEELFGRSGLKDLQKQILK